MSAINELKKDYILKGVGVPEYYLGGDVEQLGNEWKEDKVSTALSARTYIKNILEKFERILGDRMIKEARTPMEAKYHPELDESEFLDPKGHSLYRGLIGSANWCITLGRFDIAYATSTLARFSAKQRKGHLEAMCRIFGYLKKYPNNRIIIDPSMPDNQLGEDFVAKDWSEYYPDAKEIMPDGMPDPRGKEVRIRIWVDADHAHDCVTRRSVTGILVFVNNTPIKWVSRRQATIESSTYGTELIAARVATDIAVEIRYKLRMLGLNLKGPAQLFGDNMSVVLNTTSPSSQLKKKHLACAYNRVREAHAASILSLSHVKSQENHADVLTKPLCGTIFMSLISPILMRKPKSFKKETENTNGKEDNIGENKEMKE